MARLALEVADIFRDRGPAWRLKNAGHLSLEQLKVMSAIEQCRSAALGGHVLQCEDCGTQEISYNSCRNRHCGRCQSRCAKQWLAEREAELLPVEYYHLVVTLPGPIAEIAYQNKALLYDRLFRVTNETLQILAADPKHLGARIGFTAVLHTWGSAMTHHPHLHCIVPGGGLSPEGNEWISCRRGFFLPVRVISRLFRRRFLAQLEVDYQGGRLRFHGHLQPLRDPAAFANYLMPWRQREWVVYAKRPFAGPEAVLAYLARYTHRVAIANSRLLAYDAHGVTFKWKDYRAKKTERYKTMRLSTDEFIRRFLLHVLPHGFQRIRYYGIFANPQRAQNVQHIRTLLLSSPEDTQATVSPAASTVVPQPSFVCRACQSPMRVIERLPCVANPRAPPQWVHVNASSQTLSSSAG